MSKLYDLLSSVIAKIKEPKSWNDLTDKPFEEQPSVVIVDVTQEITALRDIPIASSLAIEAGITYHIYMLTPDGAIVQESVTATGTVDCINLGDIRYNDDGYILAFSYLPDTDQLIVTDSGDGGTFTIRITKEGAVKTIATKYLPKAVAVDDAAGDAPTAAEFNALLTALRDAGYLAT